MPQAKNLNLELIDICYLDYLQDHCNSDNECLISIFFTAFKFKSHLKEALREAIDQTPGYITCKQYYRCVASYINGLNATEVRQKYLDILKNNDIDPYYIIDEDKINSIESYGYFRLVWENR